MQIVVNLFCRKALLSTLAVIFLSGGPLCAGINEVRGSSICTSTLALLSGIPSRAQMLSIHGFQVPIHNQAVYEILMRHLSGNQKLAPLHGAGGPLARAAEELFGVFHEEGSFGLLMNADGSVAATPANSDPEMANFLWYRDTLRKAWIFFRLGEVETAKRIVLRVLGLIASDEKRDGKSPKEEVTDALKNAAKFNYHLGDEFWTHYRESIKVRVNVNTGRYEPWSPQVDAYALAVMVTLEMLQAGLKEGAAKGFVVSELTPDMASGVLGILSFLVSAPLEFFRQTGFWEEQPQIFTHGLMAALQALEAAHDDLSVAETNPQGSAIFQLLRKVLQSDLPGDMQGLEVANEANLLRHIKVFQGYPDEHHFSLKRRIVETITLHFLDQKVQHLYPLIIDRINRGLEVTEWLDGSGQRKGDLALVMVAFWKRLRGLTEDHYRKIIEVTLPLVGPLGIRRYATPKPDTYLQALSAYYRFSGAVIPSSFLQSQKEGLTVAGFYESFGETSRPHLEEALKQLVGDDFSMQWNFPALGAAYLAMLRWFPDTNYRENYLRGAIESFLRMVGQVTAGPGNSGKRAVNQPRDATLLGANGIYGFRFPEGRVRLGNGSAVSPNTPLYWTMAEALAFFNAMIDSFSWQFTGPRPTILRP